MILVADSGIYYPVRGVKTVKKDSAGMPSPSRKLVETAIAGIKKSEVEVKNKGLPVLH